MPYIWHMEKKTTSVVCAHCKTSFLRKTSQANEAVKNKAKQYCSKECKSASKVTSLDALCKSCGKSIRVPLSTSKKSTSGNFFCSQSCSATHNNTQRGAQPLLIKQKIREGVLRRYESNGHASEMRACLFCKELFSVQKYRASTRRGGCCSRSCFSGYKVGLPLMSPDQVQEVLLTFYKEHGFITSKTIGSLLYQRAVAAFGTWGNALSLLDIPVRNGSSYRGKNTIRCLDGHFADSAEEALLDNWFFQEGITHERNRVYPGTKMQCDFVLCSSGIWVEYLGLFHSKESYRQKYARKVALASKLGVPLLGITPEVVQKGHKAILERVTAFMDSLRLGDCPELQER